jgi:Ser/Thr protein kinase RdoA (MazF antagonist)
MHPLQAILARFDLGRVRGIARGRPEAFPVYRVRAGSQKYWVKCYPTGERSAAELDAEHRILTVLGQHGIPAPVSVLSRSGRGHVRVGNRFWMVAAELRGGPYPVTGFDRELIKNAAQFLARLHLAVPDADDLGVRRTTAPAVAESGWAAKWSDLFHRIESTLSEGRGRALAALFWSAFSRCRRELASLQGQRRALVHGDFWPGNLLTHGPQVVGVLDFEASRVDSPAYDVAVALGHFPGGFYRQEVRRPEAHHLTMPRLFMRAYREVRPMTEEELRLIPAFMKAHILMSALTWLSQRFRVRPCFPGTVDRHLAYFSWIEDHAGDILGMVSV